MLRNIISVITGLIVASVLIAVVTSVSHQIYSPPSDFNFRDKEALKELMNTLPKGALLFVILAHAVGSFGGGLTTSFIATKNRTQFTLITGGIILLMGIANLYMIPHPIWFMIADVLVYLPFAYLGGLLAIKLKP
jgi:hypothetical protein